MSMPAAAVIISHMHRNIDAVTLLMADHRYIEDMFMEFERTETPVQKQQLALQICTALMVHKDIEEEIFYPAFLAGTQHRGMHHEAIVEHDEADKLISDILDMSVEDEFFDAKVHVLSEMIASCSRGRAHRRHVLCRPKINDGFDDARPRHAAAARRAAGNITLHTLKCWQHIQGALDDLH